MTANTRADAWSLFVITQSSNGNFSQSLVAVFMDWRSALGSSLAHFDLAESPSEVSKLEPENMEYIEIAPMLIHGAVSADKFPSPPFRNAFVDYKGNISYTETPDQTTGLIDQAGRVSLTGHERAQLDELALSLELLLSESIAEANRLEKLLRKR